MKNNTLQARFARQSPTLATTQCQNTLTIISFVHQSRSTCLLIEMLGVFLSGLMEGLSEEMRYAGRNPNIKFTRVHPFVVDTGLAKKPRIR